MAHPEVHSSISRRGSVRNKLSLGPAPKLQAAILAPCSDLDVTFDMG